MLRALAGLPGPGLPGPPSPSPCSMLQLSACRPGATKGEGGIEAMGWQARVRACDPGVLVKESLGQWCVLGLHAMRHVGGGRLRGGPKSTGCEGGYRRCNACTSELALSAEYKNSNLMKQQSPTRA
eukprot:scaffold37494_cov31-Tisochrysis_lutea.AAC.1